MTLPEKKQDHKYTKEIEKLRFLFAIIKSAKSSDRELAKHLGITNTLASRRRKELEREGYIEEYTIIPSFQKMGIKFIMFSFGRTYNRSLSPEEIVKAQKWLDEQAEVLCCLEIHGADAQFMTISVHKSFEDFLAFERKLRDEPETKALDQRQVYMIDFSKEPLALKSFSYRKMESMFIPPETQMPMHKYRKNTTKASSQH